MEIIDILYHLITLIWEKIILIFTPESYQLFQNFPNPFNPNTIIGYDLPKTELISLKIYDIMGREVISLVNEIQKPGRKFLIWDAKNNLGQTVSAGMYIYTIQAGPSGK